MQWAIVLHVRSISKCPLGRVDGTMMEHCTHPGAGSGKLLRIFGQNAVAGAHSP